MGRDVDVAGRHYAGGRYHGPLTAQQVAELEAAGYGGRIFRGQLGSDELSRWEESLPIESPTDSLEAFLSGRGS